MLLRRLRILPLLVVVAGLSFSVRLGEFFFNVHQQPGTAFAQEEVNVDTPPIKEEKHSSNKNMDDGKESGAGDGSAESTELKADMGEGDAAENEESVEWQDATEADFFYSEVQAGLYKDLSKRRKELEKREDELAVQRALLEAAEREIDQKMRELSAVRDEIKQLLKEEEGRGKERVLSLVKIYEGMKAKDAARIFNTLDLDILVSVLSNMSERKSAPILASMSPERARTVTILLAKQKKLPELPPQ